MQQTVPEQGAAPSAQLLPADQRLLELRAIALSAMTFGDEGVNLWRCYAEAKRMKVPRHLRAEALETLIGLAVAARIRPSGTTRAIKTLRALRQSQGQEKKFTSFEALFKRSLGNVRLTNHGYRAESFQDMDHATVWAKVGQHIDTLDERGYPVFLNSGTLLGVVRDGKLIDHDDDVDLAVILHAETPEDAAAEWKALTADIHAKGLLDVASFGDPAIIKLLPIGDVQVDLFPGWLQGEDVFIYPHTSGQLTKDDILPVQTCAVSGNPIPRESEKVLAVNYGDAWRDPDPYFKFPWSHAQRMFSVFLEALK